MVHVRYCSTPPLPPLSPVRQVPTDSQVLAALMEADHRRRSIEWSEPRSTLGSDIEAAVAAAADRCGISGSERAGAAEPKEEVEDAKVSEDGPCSSARSTGRVAAEGGQVGEEGLAPKDGRDGVLSGGDLKRHKSGTWGPGPSKSQSV